MNLFHGVGLFVGWLVGWLILPLADYVLAQDYVDSVTEFLLYVTLLYLTLPYLDFNMCQNKIQFRGFLRALKIIIRMCIRKFPDWPPGARTANGTARCH
jgi:hypothetical protein